MDTINFFELSLLHSLQSAVQCTPLDLIMPYITSLADHGIVPILVALALLCHKRTRRLGITTSAALLLGLIFGNLMLKPLIARIRPYDLDPSIVLLIPPEHDFSFPSGHTLASFETAFSVFLYNKKVGGAALTLAALVTFSRLYLMVHYPSDVLVGLLLGCLFAYVGYVVTKRLYLYAEARRGL